MRTISRWGRCALLSFVLTGGAEGADFAVGPGQLYTSIGAVPWESLTPGDRVLIYHRPSPYKEKWVIGRSGTVAAPIVVRGVPGPGGELPVIDGRDATTRTALSYTNEDRGVIKIGSSNVPPNTLPSYIVIENLEVRSAYKDYTFTNDSGFPGIAYRNNAASIYVEKGAHLTIRNCVLHDSGNGIFIGAFDGQTRDILIEGNHIYGNSVVGRFFEHNTYTAAIGVVYQYNRFGPPRAGGGGNNLKDRSAGLVVRYNWIEGGNRQLDLVDAEDSNVLVNHPSYRQTFVYGNVLIEPDGAGNSQIVHYGGDSGNPSIFRKGTLHFYHNTVVSTRSGNTTLLRLSTNDETADVRNNVVYTTASGNRLAMLAGAGVLDLSFNWLRSGWRTSHDGGFNGTLNAADNLSGTDPGFNNLGGQEFDPAPGAPVLGLATTLHPDVLPDHPVSRQYLTHLAGELRADDGAPDLGAYERCPGCIFANGFESGDLSLWSAATP